MRRRPQRSGTTRWGTPFHLVWFSVLSRAETAIRGMVNLMMFDDRAAIEREITQAIATVK